jgi:hypothetical protein
MVKYAFPILLHLLLACSTEEKIKSNSHSLEVENKTTDLLADIKIPEKELPSVYANLLLCDQQFRDSLHSPGHSFGDRVKQFGKKMTQADSANQVILSEIIKKFNWPTTKKYGVESVETAFIITWHAPVEFKRKYLPAIFEASKRDTLNLHYYKLMRDRILLNEGKAQQFNTQHTLPDGSIKIDF